MNPHQPHHGPRRGREIELPAALIRKRRGSHGRRRVLLGVRLQRRRFHPLRKNDRSADVLTDDRKRMDRSAKLLAIFDIDPGIDAAERVQNDQIRVVARGRKAGKGFGNSHEARIPLWQRLNEQVSVEPR